METTNNTVEDVAVSTNISEMTSAEMMIYIANLKREQENLAEQLKLAKAKKNSIVSLKVAQKGGVSVYGLTTRFPTTLYVGQWLNFFAFLDIEVPEVMQSFFDDNKVEIETNYNATHKTK